MAKKGEEPRALDAFEALESDLHMLADKAKKSLPAVHEAAEIALERLRQQKTQMRNSGTKLDMNIGLSDLVRPFLLACNHANAGNRVVLCALEALQRLLSLEALDTEERMHVIRVLAIQAQSGDQIIEVKTLQTLPLLLGHENKQESTTADDRYEELLYNSIGLCCMLHQRKGLGLPLAVLTQITSMIFDNAEASISSESTHEDISLILQDRNSWINVSLRLFKEICRIAGQENVNKPDPKPGTESSDSSKMSVSERTNTSFSSIGALVEKGESHKQKVDVHERESEGSGMSSFLASNLRKYGGSLVNNLYGSNDGHSSPYTSSASLLHASKAANNTKANHGISFIERGTNYNSTKDLDGDHRLNISQALALELTESSMANRSNLFLNEKLRSAENDGKHHLFTSIVRLQVAPTLVSTLSGKSNWILMVRVMRNIVVVLRQYRNVLDTKDIVGIMDLLLDMLYDGKKKSSRGVDELPLFYTPLWHRALTLETLNLLCADSSLMCMLSTLSETNEVSNSSSMPKPERAMNLFNRTVVGMSDLVCSTLSEYYQTPDSETGLGFGLGMKFLRPSDRPTKGLDLLNETIPPSNVNVSVIILLGTESLASIADGLSIQSAHAHTSAISNGKNAQENNQRPVSPVVHIGQLYRRSSSASSVEGSLRNLNHTTGNPLGIHLINQKSDTIGEIDELLSEENRTMVTGMVLQSWKPMLDALSMLLHLAIEETVVQFLLKAYMSMMNTCGVLGLVESRNAFITSLCKFALPHWHSNANIRVLPAHVAANSRLSSKHIQSLKALFNVAHGLGGILGSAWHIVLETFEQLDYIIFCTHKQNKKSVEDGSEDQAGANMDQYTYIVDDELAIVESMLRSLFNSTKFLDDDALLSLQTALTHLSFTALAHTETLRLNTSTNTTSNNDFSCESTSRSSSPASFGSSNTNTSQQQRQNDQSQEVDDNVNAVSTGFGSANSMNLISNINNPHRQPVSIDSVSARAVSRNPPFPLEKLVETTKMNIFRLNIVWELTQNCLSTVASKSDIKLRIFAVSSMEAIVTSALLYSNPTNDSSPIVKGDEGLFSDCENKKKQYKHPATMQRELMEAFTQLTKSHYRDTREAALQSLCRIISSCGHLMDGAWSIVCEELISVAELATPRMSPGQKMKSISGGGDVVDAKIDPKYSAGNVSLSEKDKNKTVMLSEQPEFQFVNREKEMVAAASLLPSAFKAVEIIVDEFLPALPATCRPALAHCIRAFGDQTQHVNISLTAVNMLWTMCDLVQRECPDAYLYENEEFREKTTNLNRNYGQSQSNEDWNLNLEKLNSSNELFLDIFHELWHLSLDSRPEVRNSAMRTLCSIIAASSSKLTKETWRQCTLEILFPLISQVNKFAAVATVEPLQGEKLGRFSNTRMDVHHSRNTHEKQWRETKVLVLQGATRVVRACMQFAGDQSWAADVWERLLFALNDILLCPEAKGKNRITSAEVSQFRLQPTLGNGNDGSDSWPPSREVALAAVRALHEIAALVCGGSKARYASVGMQVVDGALVNSIRDKNKGQPNGISGRTGDEKGMHSLVGTGDGPSRQCLWKSVWQTYEGLTACTEKEIEPDAKMNGENQRVKMRLAGISEIDVATEMANRLGDLYSNSALILTCASATNKNSNSADDNFLRGSLGLRNTLDLLTRLLKAFPTSSKLISVLERAVLKTISQIPPKVDKDPSNSDLPEDIEESFGVEHWSMIFSELRKYGSGIDRAYSLGLSNKAAVLFQQMYEGESTPAAARALVLKQELSQMRAKIEDGNESEINALKRSSDLLPCLFRHGLRSLPSSEWPSEKIEETWMSLVDVLDGILNSSHHNNDDDENVYTKIVDSVMLEVRGLVLSSTSESVPLSVQIRILQLLSEECQRAKRLSNTKEELIEYHTLFVKACLAHLLLLLVSIDNDQDNGWFLRTMDTAVENLDIVVTKYKYMEGTKRANGIEDGMVAFLDRLCFDFELTGSPNKQENNLPVHTIMIRNVKVVLALFPVLVRLVTVKSPKVRGVLERVLTAFSLSLQKSCE